MRFSLGRLLWSVAMIAWLCMAGVAWNLHLENQNLKFWMRHWAANLEEAQSDIFGAMLEDQDGKHRQYHCGALVNVSHVADWMKNEAGESP